MAAAWLADQLAQFAWLEEHNAYPHRLLKLDEVGDDSEQLLAVLSDALQTPMPAVRIPLGPTRFPADHWRNYRDALGDAFALLTPVAVRLGYPAD